MIKQIKVSSEALEALKVSSDTIHYETGYKFLAEHKGIRPGKLHLVIGVTGGGKSTLRNSLIFDFLSKNPGKKVLLWLSEEGEEDFLHDLAKMAKDGDFKAYGKLFSNILLRSELDSPLAKDESRILKEFEYDLIKSRADLLIFDNITTSKLYGESFQQNEVFARDLKRIISNANLAAVVFAHTKSDVKRSINVLIDPNDIRGSKTIVNLSEFLYTMQTFTVESKLMTTIHIKKHRSQSPVDKIFLLSFGDFSKTYFADHRLSFDQIKEYYKMHERL